MKSLAGRISKPIIGKLNKFSDWLMSYVLEPIRNTMNERVSKLKNNVNQIFNQTENFKIEQKEGILENLQDKRCGRLRSDPKTFISNVKLKVLDLIKKQKKPIKLNTIITCKFVKENPATGQIDENSGYFRSLVETIDESTDLSDTFSVMSSRLLELIQQFQAKDLDVSLTKLRISIYKLILSNPYLDHHIFLLRKN